MDIISSYFGLNLKRLRVLKGLTQEKLAECIGINQRQLTRIETGKSFPSLITLDKICEALSISPSALFDFSSFIELKKTGTEDCISYQIVDSSNLISIKEYQKNKKQLKDVDMKLDRNNVDIRMQELAIKTKRAISVDYFEDSKFVKKINYYPNGTNSIEKEDEKENDLFIGIQNNLLQFKESPKKLKFIDLAMKSLEDKQSLEKLQIIIEGMSLL